MATEIEAARALARWADGNPGEFNRDDAVLLRTTVSDAYLTAGQLRDLRRLLKRRSARLAQLGFDFRRLRLSKPGPVPGVRQQHLYNFPT